MVQYYSYGKDDAWKGVNGRSKVKVVRYVEIEYVENGELFNLILYRKFSEALAKHYFT